MALAPQLHRVRGASRVATFPCGSTPCAVAISRGGGEIVVGCQDGVARAFDVRRHTLARTLDTRGGAVQAVATCRGSPSTALGCEDGAVHLWPSPNGDVDLPLFGHKAPVRAVSWSRDGASMLTGGDDGKVIAWDVAAGAIAIDAHQTGQALLGLRAVAFGPERIRLALAHTGVAMVWEGGSDHALSTFPVIDEKLLSARCEAFAEAPDGRLMAAARKDGIVSLFRVDEPVCDLRGHDAAAVAAAWSPLCRYFATGGEDGVLHVWDATADEPACIAEHGAPVRSVAFFPDGLHFVVALADGSIATWMLAVEEWDLGDAIEEAQALLAGELSRLFPTYRTAIDLELLLDVWSELRRCAAGVALPAELAGQGRALRESLLDLLVLLCEEVRPCLPGRGLERYKHPLFRTAMVDVSLAADLCARLGGDPVSLARLELLRGSIFPSSMSLRATRSRSGPDG